MEKDVGVRDLNAYKALEFTASGFAFGEPSRRGIRQ
jgi:hypothetical protein